MLLRGWLVKGENNFKWFYRDILFDIYFFFSTRAKFNSMLLQFMIYTRDTRRRRVFIILKYEFRYNVFFFVTLVEEIAPRTTGVVFFNKRKKTLFFSYTYVKSFFLILIYR